MKRNKVLLGIILSIILLVFSINGFTAYYKYTQESGANFYVGVADKADALEDTNEMRQIIDDLGALLVHSKRNDLYPKDATTGGTIQIPEAGLKFSNAPVNDDIAAYIAGEMAWQTKAELGIDLTLYYLKTEIDTLGEVETIYVKDIIDSDELAALKYTDLADTPAAYDNGKYAKSTVDGLVWDVPAGTTVFTGLTDTPADYTGAANKFLQVNATPDALVFDTISSDDLSDVASIAMLDEEEQITSIWDFRSDVYFTSLSDFWPYYLSIRRARDGSPTSNVSNNDCMGEINFEGYNINCFEVGASIQARVDGTPGENDIPGRLEFLTTPDDTEIPVLRMAIDNAGNIKMGDGAWTNYVNVSAAGAMTAEGTASIKATDLVIANQAAGDILYFNGTNWIRLAIGTAGQILTVNAGGTAPEWQTP